MILTDRLELRSSHRSSPQPSLQSGIELKTTGNAVHHVSLGILVPKVNSGTHAPHAQLVALQSGLQSALGSSLGSINGPPASQGLLVF